MNTKGIPSRATAEALERQRARETPRHMSVPPVPPPVASGLTLLSGSARATYSRAQELLKEAESKLAPLLLEVPTGNDAQHPTFPTAPGFREIRDCLDEINTVLDALAALVARVDV